MIQRTVISASEKELITIEQVKNALGFGSRTDKDDEIAIILNTAISQVEEYGNVSLRSYDVQVSYSSADTDNVLYLHPVSGITSVRSLTGIDIDYCLGVDNRRFYLSTAKPCVVNYTTTQIDENQAQPYIRAVIELSMLMFNGNTDTAESTNVLRKIAYAL